jgi:transforming growth factor-beta-induced protein
MSIPSMDTLKHISDRLKANDIAWFKDRFQAGEFSWLKEHLPEGGYTTLGERIEAGDLGYVRTLFRGLSLPGFGTLFGAAGVGAAATAGVAGAAGAAKAAMTTGEDDRKKKGAVWLLPLALLAAILIGFGLSRLGKDKNDDKVAADTTAVAEESVAPATDLPTETDPPEAAAAGDIIETAKGAGSFNTLTAAIDAAGLTETLKGEGPFTVFAPTDDAFKALPAGLVDALLKPENKETLTKILTYHVVPGKVLAADIKPGDVATVEGGTVKLATDGGVTVNDAKVIGADVPSSNGVIHVIDKVLVPSGVDVAALLAGPATTAAPAPAAETIVDVATANGSFKTLTAAIGAAGLTDTLKGPGPFTVFAPTDDAFKALPAGLVDALLKPENKETLTKILTYHVVPAKITAAEIAPGDAATVEGGTVKLATEGGVTVNDAKVVTADVAASNGIIHVIDKVLVPTDVDVAALLGGAAAPTTTAAVDLTTTNKAGDATPEDLTAYFDSGSARINAAAQAKIDGAVKLLSTAPAGTKVALIGRADKTGDAAANLALSKRRASAVEAALVKGLADKAANVTFTADAKGDEEQADDLAFARRVTIEIAK